MSAEENKLLGLIFILTAIFSILFPLSLMLAINDYIVEIFTTLHSDEDSIYWVIALFVILGLFTLLCSYMIFNKVKNNVTIKSKIWAFIFLPLLITGTTISSLYFGFSHDEDDRGPYLSWMADPKTTMTVTFEIKTSGDYNLYYGESETSLGSKIPFIRSEIRAHDGYYHYTANITGLSPDTRYYYNIPGFKEAPIPFRTAPDTQASEYKFLLYGDTREDNKLFDNQHIALIEQLKEQIDVSELAFAINTGDTARTHGNVNLWNLHFHAIKDLAKSVPYFVASGNHEWNGGDSWNLNAQPALDIQDFPIGDDPKANVYSLDEVSYTFGYGNAFFIFLGYPHVGSNNSRYLNWLNTQLEIGNNTYDFTFVSLHRPPFDDREGENGDDNEDIIKSEAQMFHYGGVDAVFCGHNHVLAHQNITWDGDPSGRTVTYLISGGAGASLRNPQYGTWNDDYGMGFQGKTVYCKGTYHYYIVEVDGKAGTATFTAYELGGEILESFSINQYKN